MKVFVSWSGDIAHEVAKVLRLWLPTVLQAVEPWVSSEDIGKGRRWSGEIERELQECRFGIICVTPNNRDSQWLNFEAGALASRVSEAIEERRVTPLLVGLDQAQLTGPLTQFQTTSLVPADIRRLIQDMNHLLTSPVAGTILEPTLDHWVPRLLEDLGPLVESAGLAGDEVVPARTSEEVQSELLALVRDQARSIARLENQLEYGSSPSSRRTADRSVIDEIVDFFGRRFSQGSVGSEGISLAIRDVPSTGDLRYLEDLSRAHSIRITLRQAEGEGKWVFPE